MFKENEKVLVWLSLFDFLSSKKQNTLINLYSNPIDLWNSFSQTNNKLLEILTKEEINKMEFLKDDNYLKTYYENLKQQNIKVVTLASENYPKLLKETGNPPIILYCKGNTELLNTKCVSIVGTRRPTRYGREVTAQFAGALAKAGITIVSGLADGIDAEAHKVALEVNGSTIAVLGCGVNEIYPISNSQLYREIAEKGLLISEYKPSEKPQTYYFPARNRIIAGLSEGVLITEAADKSGSMHTKNYALDYNRNLFVVPGRINDVYSSGCNLIIKNLQGSMVLSPKDILTAYGLDEKQEERKIVQLDFNDEIVYSAIAKEEEVHYENILIKTNLEPKNLNTILIRLELKGLIKKLSGNYYCKNRLS